MLYGNCGKKPLVEQRSELTQRVREPSAVCTSDPSAATDRPGVAPRSRYPKIRFCTDIDGRFLRSLSRRATGRIIGLFDDRPMGSTHLTGKETGAKRE